MKSVKKTYLNLTVRGTHKKTGQKLKLDMIGFTDKELYNREKDRINIDTMKSDYKNFKVKETKTKMTIVEK